MHFFVVVFHLDHYPFVCGLCKEKDVTCHAMPFIIIRPVRLTYKPYFFNRRTVFFSHNKSANSTFSHGLSAKRTEQLSKTLSEIDPQNPSLQRMTRGTDMSSSSLSHGPWTNSAILVGRITQVRGAAGKLLVSDRWRPGLGKPRRVLAGIGTAATLASATTVA